jgi:hypothetical protein
MRIVKAIDKRDATEIDETRIQIEKHLSKSSNTKSPIYRVFIDDQLIKKHNHYIAHYVCSSCDRTNIVALNNIIRKMNRGVDKCNTCKNLDLDKRQQQSLFMKDHNPQHESKAQEVHIEPPPKRLYDKLQEDATHFDAMDDTFKEQYFRKHMTSDEFILILPKIMSFQHDKYMDLSKFVYYPAVKIPNQAQFHPYLYDTVRDTLEKIIYVRYKCDSCGDVFENRDLCVQKNKLKVLCCNCNFTNNVFKIRPYTNCNGEKVLYQSKHQLNFIKKCNDINLKVVNGPYVTYEHDGKQRKYKVDFAIPSLRLLIECKDNHHWHKDNLNTGKWQEKERAALNLVHSGEYVEFIMVFPKNIMEVMKKIKTMVNKI